MHQEPLEPCTGLDFDLTLAPQGLNSVPLPSCTGLYNVGIFRFSPAPVPCGALEATHYRIPWLDLFI